MSGAAGHLSHPYENLNFSFQDLIDLLRDASDGKLEGVSEKTDGINLNFSVFAGEVRVARNKSQLLKGGLDRAELERFFEGRGGIQKAFLAGFDAIQDVCRRLPEKALQEALASRKGQVWLSAEIISPDAPITIRYDSPSLVVHSGPAKLVTNLNAVEDFDASFTESIFAAANGAKLAGGWTFWNSIPVSLAAMDGSAVKQAIVSLKELCGGKLALKLYDYLALKKPNIHLLTVKERQNLTREILAPVEQIVVDFSIERLRGLKSSMINNGDQEVERIRRKISDVIQQVEASGDQASLLKMKKNLARLKKIDNVSSALEGIVFKRGAKYFKLTGAFGAFHQIVSLPAFDMVKSQPVFVTNESMKPKTVLAESKFDLSVMDRIREAVETNNVSITTALQLERFLTAGYISLSEAHAILDKACTLSHQVNEQEMVNEKDGEKKPSANKLDRQKSFCKRLQALQLRSASQEPVPEDPESCIKKALKRWKARCKA